MQGGYPARLKKVLIVTAPLWFKAPFKILRLFVREKLRERVFTVSVPQLSLHVPREQLPKHLGGSLEINHSTWLLHCYKSMTNREDELFVANCGQQQQQQQQTATSAIECGAAGTVIVTNGDSDNGKLTIDGQDADDIDIVIGDLNKNGVVVEHNNTTATITQNTSDSITLSNNTNSNIENGDTNETGSDAVAVLVANGGSSNNGSGHSQLSEMWSENPPSSASSGFSDDDSLAYSEGDPKTIEQIVELVREKGREGLAHEYAEIRGRAPDGTFTQARVRNNLAKNRYTDVLCYDHSRVILSTENEEPTSDYINANFVDGYKQKNAYISTQGTVIVLFYPHCSILINFGFFL